MLEITEEFLVFDTAFRYTVKWVDADGAAHTMIYNTGTVWSPERYADKVDEPPQTRPPNGRSVGWQGAARRRECF